MTKFSPDIERALEQKAHELSEARGITLKTARRRIRDRVQVAPSRKKTGTGH